jgi:hypothetical protein
MYADDTKVYSEVKDPQAAERLQGDLDKLMDWSEVWKLKFNVEKCKVMHVGNNNILYNYTMGKDNLTVTHKEKDLGVFITDNLKQSAQCKASANNARFRLISINKTFKYADANTRVRLFKTFVRPLMESSIQAWNPQYKKDIEALERVQKTATKWIPSVRHLDYESRLKKLKLLPLWLRRHRGDLILTYKIIQGLDNIKASSIFKLKCDINTRKTDDSTALFKSNPPPYHSAKDSRNHFFTQRVINEWNKLPRGVREADSVLSFKRALDRYLETEYGHSELH